VTELANESATDDNSQQESPSVEALQQKLEQQEVAFKELKDSFSAQKQEWMQEQKTQSDKVSNLGGRLEERERQTAEAPVDPYVLTDEQKDKFTDNPSLMTGFVQDRIDESVDVVVRALRERDAMQNEQFAELKGSLNSRFESVDPETLQWKEAIDSLQENAAFKGLPKETLIAIAKDKDMKPSMEYRGSAADGGQRSRETSKEYVPVKFGPEVQGYARIMAMSNSPEMAENIWNRMEVTKGSK
jgi:hypothetical protein